MNWPWRKKLAVKSERQWIESPDHGLGWKTVNLVDVSSQRIEATIQNYGRDGIWHVYRYGAAYGQYMTREAAIRKAEGIA